MLGGLLCATGGRWWHRWLWRMRARTRAVATDGDETWRARAGGGETWRARAGGGERRR